MSSNNPIIQKLTIHPNGAQVKLHNRRIIMAEHEDDFELEFLSAGVPNPELPAAVHRCLKGKARSTSVSLTKEAMEAMVYAYLEYKRHKETETTYYNNNNHE